MSSLGSRIRRWLALLPLLALPVTACTGAATAPAPLAEIPSLQFPETVAIDVDTTLAAPGSGFKFLVTPNGPFFEEITLGAGLVSTGNAVTNAVLGPLSSFQIPTGSEVTTFSIAINEGGTLKTLQIDFADYDFDGDGSDEGCSGNTAELPICYRIWVGGERRIAGLFEDEFPTPTQIGKGRFIAAQVNLSGEAGFDRVRAVYDHRDLLNKFTELLLPFEETKDGDTTGPVAHSFAQSEGPGASALKTVNFTVGPLFNGITQWREGQDFWLGTINDFVDVSPDIDSLTNQCAFISSQEAADISLCSGAGLDLSGLDFPSVENPSVLEFPADFPISPTFSP